VSRTPHEVLATREARGQLPSLLERFRKHGGDAEPVVIGARRRPEAVVLSYERYLELAGGAPRSPPLSRAKRTRSGPASRRTKRSPSPTRRSTPPAGAPDPLVGWGATRVVLDPNILISALFFS
jgi:hypothetical protein